MKNTEIVETFCIVDDYLRAIEHKDYHNSRVSTSEILTTAIIAAKEFGGNYKKSREFLQEFGYIPQMLSESQFVRRLNAIEENVLHDIFSIMAKAYKLSNPKKHFIIDSFPVPVCSNIRINRCRIYQDKKYKGFRAVQREFFYGVRVHMIISESGMPIEFVLKPGSHHDVKVARSFLFDLPQRSTIHADKAYNDYDLEDRLEFQKLIYLAAIRKKNSKRKQKRVCYRKRKTIETAFSIISRYFPKKIHAITARGFERKIFLFVFAYAISFLLTT